MGTTLHVELPVDVRDPTDPFEHPFARCAVTGYSAPVPSVPVENMPRSCGGCAARWYGPNRCHCGGCHRTFDAVEEFTRHRPRFGCVDPTSLQMRSVGGVWRR